MNIIGQTISIYLLCEKISGSQCRTQLEHTANRNTDGSVRGPCNHKHELTEWVEEVPTVRTRHPIQRYLHAAYSLFSLSCTHTEPVYKRQHIRSQFQNPQAVYLQSVRIPW